MVRQLQKRWFYELSGGGKDIVWCISFFMVLYDAELTHSPCDPC